MLDQYRALSAA